MCSDSACSVRQVFPGRLHVRDKPASQSGSRSRNAPCLCSKPVDLIPSQSKPVIPETAPRNTSNIGQKIRHVPRPLLPSPHRRELQGNLPTLAAVRAWTGRAAHTCCRNAPPVTDVPAKLRPALGLVSTTQGHPLGTLLQQWLSKETTPGLKLWAYLEGFFICVFVS